MIVNCQRNARFIQSYPSRGELLSHFDELLETENGKNAFFTKNVEWEGFFKLPCHDPCTQGSLNISIILTQDGKFDCSMFAEKNTHQLFSRDFVSESIEECVHTCKDIISTRL